MYTESKVLLSINLQGGTLIRESKVTKIEWALTLGDVKSSPKKKLPEKIAERIVRRGRAQHHNLVAKQAVKVVCLGEEAYNYMTGVSSFEGWMLKEKGSRKKDWVKMLPEVRLQYHLERLSAHYGGKSFTFQILE